MDIEANCAQLQKQIETMLSVFEEVVNIARTSIDAPKNDEEKENTYLLTQRVYNISRMIGALSVAEDAIITVEAIRSTHDIKIADS